MLIFVGVIQDECVLIFVGVFILIRTSGKKMTIYVIVTIRLSTANATFFLLFFFCLLVMTNACTSTLRI